MSMEVEPIYRMLGAKVAQIRNLLGKRQEDVAKAVGMSRAALANIEAGRQRIMMHDVESLARALGTEPKSLLRGMWW